MNNDNFPDFEKVKAIKTYRAMYFKLKRMLRISDKELRSYVIESLGFVKFEKKYDATLLRRIYFSTLDAVQSDRTLFNRYYSVKNNLKIVDDTAFINKQYNDDHQLFEAKDIIDSSKLCSSKKNFIKKAISNDCLEMNRKTYNRRLERSFQDVEGMC
ncbi:hypothetical protein [Lentilactobacillus kefiri]|uniref:hypothetical protein n=2 Tax=Bacilli TaxID=91061 RepID=UPI000BA7A3CC|nr:hypothetical protein [Lentilactobacillus kefiri]PAK82465.1 hypothetical protein B8W85_08160 [Lentilactobacillus kefiri]